MEQKREKKKGPGGDLRRGVMIRSFVYELCTMDLGTYGDRSCRRGEGEEGWSGEVSVRVVFESYAGRWHERFAIRRCTRGWAEELEGRLREERVFLSVGSRLRWRARRDHRFDKMQYICIYAYKRSQEDPDDS